MWSCSPQAKGVVCGEAVAGNERTALSLPPEQEPAVATGRSVRQTALVFGKPKVLSDRTIGIGAVAVALAVGGLSPAGAGVHDSRQTVRYRQRVWTREHGLPDDRVQAVAQTTDGYLWIGTVAGLVRFDGRVFTRFSSADLPELGSDQITVLAADQDGSLWIGTTRNLVRYSRQRTRAWTIGTPGDEEIRGLSAAPGNGVWVATRYAIRYFHDGDWVSVPAIQRNPEPWVHGVAAGPDGRLWHGYGTGLRRYDPHTDRYEAGWRAFAEPGLTERAVRRGESGTDMLTSQTGAKTVICALWPTGPESCWAYWTTGSAYTLTFWEHGAWQRWDVPPPVDLDGRCIPMFADRAGNLWMSAGRHGLHRFREGEFVRYTRSDGLSDDWILCGLEDREGNLWFGTFAGGLNRWQPQPLQTVLTQEGKPLPNTWAVLESQDGAMWIGTDDGLMRKHADRLEQFTTEHGLPGNAVRALAEDGAGRLWVGFGGTGLSCWESNRFVNRSLPGGLPANKIRALCSGRDDRLWIGTEEGLHVLIGGPQGNCARVEGMAPSDIRALWEDRLGRLWIGTHGAGLWRWADGRLRVFTVADMLAADHVWALCEGGDGVMWIGTRQGISRLQGDRIVSLTQQHGLPEPLVNSVVDDSHGRLWFGGDRGIYWVSKEAFSAVAEGRARRLTVATYGVEDGMLVAETNGQKSGPPVWRTRNGRLWFPTPRGAVWFDPEALVQAHAPPQVVIDEVRVAGETVCRDGRWRGGQGGAASAGNQWARPAMLPAGSGRVLEFAYTAPGFVSPDKTRFCYRLVGHEGDWHDAGTRRVALYANLRPGPYRFEVTACTVHGDRSRSPATLAFRVLPFYYETWWFRGLAVALVLGSVVSVHRWRLHTARRFHALKHQHALATERARIASDLHDDLGARLSQLVLLSEMLDRQPQDSPQATRWRRELADNAREAAQAVTEAVWAANPECDRLDHLASFLIQYTERFLAPTNWGCRFDFPSAVPGLPVSATARHAVFLVVKEALHNIVCHARGRTVRVGLALEEDRVVLWIEDDGQGFDGEGAAARGNGLRNMQSRAGHLGGTLRLERVSGGGTRVVLTVSRRDLSLPTPSIQTNDP